MKRDVPIVMYCFICKKKRRVRKVSSVLLTGSIPFRKGHCIICSSACYEKIKVPIGADVRLQAAIRKEQKGYLKILTQRKPTSS